MPAPREAGPPPGPGEGPEKEKGALEYLGLAQEAHGPIPRPVPPTYVWGEAGLLDTLDALRAAGILTAVGGRIPPGHSTTMMTGFDPPLMRTSGPPARTSCPW